MLARYNAPHIFQPFICKPKPASVPKEFWRLCNCCAPILVRSDPKSASDALRALFHSIGERIKAADPQYALPFPLQQQSCSQFCGRRYAAGLFNDYCLPKIAQTLRQQPSMCVL